MTCTRAGPRHQPPPSVSGGEKGKAAEDGWGAPPGPTQVWGATGARRSGEAPGEEGRSRVCIDSGAPRAREEAAGRAVRARAVASAEFGELGEVAQTLRACFLFFKMATVVEQTLWALLVVLLRELIELP